MVRFSIISLFCLGIAAASGKATIDPSLTAKFFGGGGSGQSVMVSFTQSMDSVFSQINSMNFTSLSDKRQALTELQEAFTNAAQAPLQGFLGTQGVSFESFWINNKMVINNAGPGLISAISMIPGVSSIEPEPQANVFPALDPSRMEIDDGNLTREARQSRSEWGIRAIRADQVWGSYQGRGVVVGIIDTGVRGTHESFRSRFRSDYGWLDPYQSTSTPNDQNGHGTHVTGTIVGENGIGVAPQATWIACKGCSSNGCGGSELMRCGQWMQCPTRPDGSARRCDLAPKVVSCSWGSSNQGSTWYDNIIRSWHDSGIIPVFALGNSGSRCNTAGNPGDRPNVIAVGNIDSRYRIASSSSRGAARDGRVKPDICAPGSQIRSAWHTSDSAYNSISGTSMACPHVSGVVALMFQKNSGLNYDQVYNAITRSANRQSLQTSSAQACNGVSSSSWPNNAFGHGLVDAPNSVNAI